MTAAGDRSRALAAESKATGAVEPLTEPEFTAVYNANSGPLFGYLLGVTGRRDVAEDLLQESFCRLLAQTKRSADPIELRRYLFRIATNLLRDRWRRGEDKPFSEPVEHGHTPAPETTLDVRAALAQLKPRERELLWLAYVEGMDHAEIAVATGLARLSIRMLLFRARKKASKFLQIPDADRKPIL